MSMAVWALGPDGDYFDAVTKNASLVATKQKCYLGPMLAKLFLEYLMPLHLGSSFSSRQSGACVYGKVHPSIKKNTISVQKSLTGHIIQHVQHQCALVLQPEEIQGNAWI